MPRLSHTLSDGESSHIQSFSHEGTELTVTFTNGRSHTFAHVPSEVFHNFKRDVSKGKYFHQVVKRSYHQKLQQS